MITHIEKNGKVYQTVQDPDTNKWIVLGYEGKGPTSYKKAIQFIRSLILAEQAEPTLFN